MQVISHFSYILGLRKPNRPHESGGGLKQDEVIEHLARGFYPAILEDFNSEASEAGRQTFAAWQAELAGRTAKEKHDVPAGNALFYISIKNDFSAFYHPAAFVVCRHRVSSIFRRVFKSA